MGTATPEAALESITWLMFYGDYDKLNATALIGDSALKRTNSTQIGTRAERFRTTSHEHCSMRFGPAWPTPNAHDLRSVHDPKTAIRQNHDELGAVRNEKKMIWCRNSQTWTAISQLNFKGLEWGGIAHFTKSLGILHGESWDS